MLGPLRDFLLGTNQPHLKNYIFVGGWQCQASISCSCELRVALKPDPSLEISRCGQSWRPVPVCKQLGFVLAVIVFRSTAVICRHARLSNVCVQILYYQIYARKTQKYLCSDTLLSDLDTRYKAMCVKKYFIFRFRLFLVGSVLVVPPCVSNLDNTSSIVYRSDPLESQI